MMEHSLTNFRTNGCTCSVLAKPFAFPFEFPDPATVEMSGQGNPGADNSALPDTNFTGDIMKKFLAWTTALAVLVLFVVAFTLVEAFVFMIVLGILWGEFGWLAPIGLLPAWGLVTLGAGVLGMVGRAWRSNSHTDHYREVTDIAPSVTNIYN